MGFPEYIGTDPKTVEMRADNQGAIALAKNPHLHERSKHIDISYHHIRDLEERKKIKITYVPTTEMVADGFTKPLERVAFEKFKSMLGLVDGSAKNWKQRCSGS
jgi:H2-forming N5,N10-methylenetetrahydromethanopterin dehydrogenase-like enzyme